MDAVMIRQAVLLWRMSMRFRPPIWDLARLKKVTAGVPKMSRPHSAPQTWIAAPTTNAWWRDVSSRKGYATKNPQPLKKNVGETTPASSVAPARPARVWEARNSHATITTPARKTAVSRALAVRTRTSRTAAYLSAKAKNAVSTDAAAFAVSVRILSHASTQESASANVNQTVQEKTVVRTGAADFAAPALLAKSVAPMVSVVKAANLTVRAKSVVRMAVVESVETVLLDGPVIFRTFVLRTAVNRTAPVKSVGPTVAEASVETVDPANLAVSVLAKPDAHQTAQERNVDPTDVAGFAEPDVR